MKKQSRDPKPPSLSFKFLYGLFEADATGAAGVTFAVLLLVIVLGARWLGII